MVVTNISETSEFLTRIGYPIKPDEIIEVFPGYFPNRRVLRVRSNEQSGCHVVKIRPYDDEGLTEVKKLQLLLASERFLGSHWPDVRFDSLNKSSYMAIKMPYLGIDLTRLGKVLDLWELGYIDEKDVLVKGFTASQIKHLASVLRLGHAQFSEKYGLVHGDLFIGNVVPNNLVYQPEMDKLFMVDAEALARVSGETTDRFYQQVDQVEEWMCTNLLIK